MTVGFGEQKVGLESLGSLHEELDGWTMHKLLDRFGLSVLSEWKGQDLKDMLPLNAQHSTACDEDFE